MLSATSVIGTRFKCWSVNGDYTGQDQVVVMDIVVKACKSEAGALLDDAFAFSNLFLFLEGLKVPLLSHPSSSAASACHILHPLRHLLVFNRTRS